MLLKIYEKNTNPAHIRTVADTLRSGGVIIFPTDTVYAFGCDLFNKNGIEQIAKIKNKDLAKTNMSFVCSQISQISEYAKMSDVAYKLIKRNLPGAFTFILNGNNNLPKLFKNRKTVGVRMPDNPIALAIINELGNPLMTSSIFYNDQTTEYITDPELIEEKYGTLVDLIVDGGEGGLIPSTIVDCTTDETFIIRQGAGELV
ncbi:MAG: L-threonylcarbamoyladenylate synthase [Paludibacter sp.]|nr:L-threonylcarbamoyladenylate synthase [Paludibacter sp.]